MTIIPELGKLVAALGKSHCKMAAYPALTIRYNNGKVAGGKMETIFEIVSNVSTPLGLAGIFASVFMFSIMRLINAGILAKTTKRTSGRITILIINRLFILAFITIFLGFIGFFLKNVAVLKSDRATDEAIEKPMDVIPAF